MWLSINILEKKIDKPFKLDILLGILCYVYKDSYQSVTDDKSGYDHILLVWFLSCSICPFCLLLSFCFGLLYWTVHVCTCATTKVSLFRLYFWHMSSSLHYHPPPTSKEEFIAFLRDILSREIVELLTLQKLAGKCISMTLAVLGAC